MTTTMTKKQTIKARITELRQLMESNDAALEDAILAIYDNQTDREKSTQATLEDNGVGFNGADAELLTSFAEQILDRRSRGREPGRSLSQPKHGREGQIGWARRKMKKYARQLAKMEWFYHGPSVAPAQASARLEEARSVDTPARSPVPGFSSRLEALQDAYLRIEAGKAWIENNRDQSDSELFHRANTKLLRLMAYAEQLVTDATEQDILDPDFRRLARKSKPCVCGGTGKYYSGGAVVNGVYTGKVGDCFRCGGKGFQTLSDEKRNEAYDRHRRIAP